MYTRIRSKGTLVPLPAVGNSVGTFFDGKTITSALATRPVYSTDLGPYVVTSDNKTPSFNRRRAAGEVFCNPFKGEVQNRVIHDKEWGHVRQTALYPGESTAAFKGWELKSTLYALGSCLSSLPGGAADPFGPDLTAVADMCARNVHSLDIAYQAAMSNVASTNALLVVTAAEMGKTINLLGHYASVLGKQSSPFAKLWQRFERGQISRNEALAFMGSEWMAFRYGVMPTFYEIRGVVDALRKAQLPQRQTARGQSTWSDSFTRTVTAPRGVYQATNLRCVTTCRSTVRAGVLYEPLHDDLNTRLGLSLYSLPSTALELVKWSWMADWFVNLSDTVKALEAPLFGKFLTGWTTQTLECHTRHTFEAGYAGSQTVVVNGTTYPTTWVYSGSPTEATVDVFFTTKTRTPMYDMRVRMPCLRNRMRWTHVADTLALVAQNLSSVGKLTKALRI